MRAPHAAGQGVETHGHAPRVTLRRFVVEPNAPRSEREYHFLDVTNHPPRDLLELSAAASGVEQRCPFVDWRVISYCLAVPSAHKIAGGLTRMLTRRAFAATLPAAVAARTGNAVPGASLLRRFLEADAERLEDALFGKPSELLGLGGQ